MRHPLAVAFFAGVCLSVSFSAACAGGFLVVPGRSIGQTALGPNGAAEMQRLPPPKGEEDGMSQQRMVWVSRTQGRTDTLYLHITRNGALGVWPLSGNTIDIIRVTSRRFHTRNGLSTASTLAQICRRFPAVPPASATTGFYDVPRQGISFEFAQPVTPASRCIAITVYPPAGDAPNVSQADIARLLGGSP